MSQIKTLAEAMAIAVLKGDMAAALALADKLIEERSEVKRDFATLIEQSIPGTPVTGYEVYRWPEFIAFAQRLGFKWDLRTIECTITMKRDELVRIDHVYAGNNDTPPPAVNTTTMQNQQFATYAPNLAAEQ